jgi:DNA-binding transcriptional LysR family regulator
MAGHGFVGNSLCASIRDARVQEAMADTPVHAHNMFSLVGLLHTGRWFTILPKTVVDGLRTDLVFRPIDGLHDLRTVSVLVPNRSTQRQFVDAFVGLLSPRT